MSCNVEKTQRLLKLKRKAFSLVEILIAIVVIGILVALSIVAGTSAQNKARLAVARNDLDSMKNSVYQALLTYPEVMRYKDDDTNWATNLVEYINSELDDSWTLKMVPGNETNTVSGGIAYTETYRDPWGAPYGVYAYTDSHADVYRDETGAALSDSDSVLYIVIMSAGPNGTGGPMGYDGSNASGTTRDIVSSTAMVNNTDGIDDVGIIIRVLNGSTYYASFGFKDADLGTLEGDQWILGEIGASAQGGIYRDFAGESSPTSIVYAGSLDHIPNAETLEEYKTGGDPAHANPCGQFG